MKRIVFLCLILLPTIVFAEDKTAKKFIIYNIKVKETNSIGKPQEADKSVLLDSQSGNVWLFIGGKDDNNVRLIPIVIENKNSIGKGK